MPNSLYVIQYKHFLHENILGQVEKVINESCNSNEVTAIALHLNNVKQLMNNSIQSLV